MFFCQFYGQLAARHCSAWLQGEIGGAWDLGSIQHHPRLQEKVWGKTCRNLGLVCFSVDLPLNTNWVKCQPRINPSCWCLNTYRCSLTCYTCFMPFILGPFNASKPMRNAIHPMSTTLSHMFLTASPCSTRWNTMLDPWNIHGSTPGSHRKEVQGETSQAAGHWAQGLGYGKGFWCGLCILCPTEKSSLDVRR